MSYRVLFAGGCHIDGNGEQGATKLSRIAIQALEASGVSCQTDYLVQVDLAHPRRLAAKCVEFKPDVLILQAGHRETTGLVAHYLMKRFRSLRKKKRAFETAAASTCQLPRTWAQTALWSFRLAGKCLVHYASGRRLLDMERFSASLDVFLDRVAALAIPNVVVMSPLPCIDPIAMYYRREIEPVFRRAALGRGFQFVSALDLDAPGIHLDALHLNGAGHRAVGKLLAESLLGAGVVVLEGGPTRVCNG